MEQSEYDTLDRFDTEKCYELMIPMDKFVATNETDLPCRACHHLDDGRLTLEIKWCGATITGIYSPPYLQVLGVIPKPNSNRNRLEQLITLLTSAVRGTFEAICYWNFNNTAQFSVKRVTVQDGKVAWEDITP